MKPERHMSEDGDSGIPIQNGPPDAHQVCTALLDAYVLRHQALPACMPPVPRDAANWWISRQEPEAHIERPRKLPVAGNEKGKELGHRWEAPYVLRLAHNLGIFLCMTASQQRIIVAAIEEGIPWRGDEYGQFLMVIEEHERMREIGVEEYRRQVRDQFRYAIYRLTQEEVR